MKYPEYYPYPNGCYCPNHASCHCDVITGYSKCLCDKGYTMDGGQCVGKFIIDSVIFDMLFT